MPGKRIEFGREARARLRAGVSKFARVLQVTFGPRGRTVAIAKAWGGPVITRDGPTVAKELAFEDRIEDTAAQLLRQAALKTAEAAGDGTTTATLLAAAIFEEALRTVEAGGDPARLQRGLERAREAATAHLVKQARKVRGREDLQNVAAIAGGDDDEIGRLIADALEKRGRDGAVLIEEGSGVETQLERAEGFQFEQGYLSPHFVNRPERAECVLNNPLILVHEKRLESAAQVMPVLEMASKAKRPLFILCEDVDGALLATLVVNAGQEVLSSCVVKAPEFGERRREMMEDFAVMTGARPVMADAGIALGELTLADLGSAKCAVVERGRCTLLEGRGKAQELRTRANGLKRAIQTASTDHDRERLEARLAKLSGGLVRIRVGAATESAVKERRGRFEDALRAARAAIEEGVVPGGGVALLRAGAALDKLKPAFDEEGLAIAILKRALQEPLMRIAENSGEPGRVAVARVIAAKDPDVGFNGRDLRYENLVRAGIIDPVKVVRLALANAVSIATVLLTSDAVITEPAGADSMKPPGFDEGIPG